MLIDGKWRAVIVTYKGVKYEGIQDVTKDNRNTVIFLTERSSLSTYLLGGERLAILKKLLPTNRLDTYWCLPFREEDIVPLIREVRYAN